MSSPVEVYSIVPESRVDVVRPWRPSPSLGPVLLGARVRPSLALVNLLVPPKVRHDREVLAAPFNLTRVGCPQC